MLTGLILLTSGCIDNGGSTESAGDQAITVERLSVTPQTILADSSTTAILHISNTGQLDANLTVDSGWRGEEVGSNYGDRLLTNRCRDIFTVDDFSARGPGDASKDRYEMPSGTEARFTWSLSTRNSNVPIQGLSCGLKFQVPFDYSVNAYRQLQFVENREITGTPELSSRSSAGPMSISIETIGSTSQLGPSTFVQGDNAEVSITMRHQQSEDSSYTGFIEASIPEIEAEGFEFAGEAEDEINRCLGDFEEDDQLVMYNGESQAIRCSISDQVFEDLDGSTRGEIQVSANYTYVKDLGTEEVKVEYRG